MKSSVQFPQKSTIRRSKEKLHKTVTKCLVPAFSAASESNPVYHSPISAKADVNQESDLFKDVSKSPIPSPSDSYEPEDPLETVLPLLISDGNQECGKSDSSKTENVDVQVAVDYLLAARCQVLNSSDVDVRSKRLLDCVIKNAIEPLDELPEDHFGFYDLLRMKVWLGLLCLLMWIISVSVVMLRNDGVGTGFPGIPPPT